MLKREPWNYKPRDFFTTSERFRERAGDIARTAPDNIAIVSSASYGLAIAARNLAVRKGQTIVTLTDQFPSNVYTWRELAERSGAHVVAVQREAEACWTEAVLNAIDDRTAIAALPHCHWADGRLVDLERVGKRCREVGAALVLDLTQSLGAMPLDLAAVRPDYAVAACYKWLMGPYGIGMLYVDPRHHRGDPLEQNWINRGGSEDFARLVEYRDDYQPGARRYDIGERSNPPLLHGAIAAFDFLLEFGIEAIAQNLGRTTSRIAEAASRQGLTAAPLGKRAPHFLSLGFPDGVPDGLTEKLAERRVFVSLRGQSLRVTPHLYNTKEDADALLETLSEVL